MNQQVSSSEKKLPQPGDYARNWQVVAGDVGHQEPPPGSGQEPEKKYFAVLVYEAGDGTFQLFSQKEENGIVGEMIWRQDLHYNPETGTLESSPDDTWLERSINFWRGDEATGRPDRIYAMRKASLGAVEPDVIEARLLPWEYRKEQGDDGEILVATPYGAWGAEGG